MARCVVCDKGVHFGNSVSHSHRKASKMWKPNIRNVKAVVDGQTKKISVCSKCLRSGKVQRAV
jgi:large subunit ribosomal protein L28